MNSEIQNLLKLYTSIGTLLEIVSTIPYSQTTTIRIGLLDKISDSFIVLKPHNNSLAKQAYGGDILCDFDIIPFEYIREILILSNDDKKLKTIIKDSE